MSPNPVTEGAVARGCDVVKSDVGMRPKGDNESNWTAQRSAERESEMGYLARIRMEEARDAMDSTITMIEKTAPFRSSPAGGEKAPCVHNEPVIGMRLPASVREDNHDIPPCTLEPPLLLSEEILMLRHTLGAMASKLRVGPSKMLATRQAFLRRARIPSSVRDPRLRNAAIGPMDRDPTSL
ncbi:hypothetical protein V8E54_000697 [Elaphomyces granulatus]